MSTDTEVVTIGSVVRVRLSVNPSDPGRIDTFKIGTKGQKDYSSWPRVIPSDSECAVAFVGQSIGYQTIFHAAPNSGQPDQYATLVSIHRDTDDFGDPPPNHAVPLGQYLPHRNAA